MKKFFKKLFCKHEYEYLKRFIETCKEPDFSGDGCGNTWEEIYEIYKCKKCGKLKKKFIGSR